jgi:hypothetical protein
MSQQARPVLDISVQAVGTAIAYARAVNVVAGAAALGAIGGTQATVAGQKIIGIARRDAAVGAFTELTTLGTAVCEAGAAIAIGARVQCDASGRVITATALTIATGAVAVTSAAVNGAGTISGGDTPLFVFGTALQAAAAAGDFIEVLIGN